MAPAGNSLIWLLLGVVGEEVVPAFDQRLAVFEHLHVGAGHGVAGDPRGRVAELDGEVGELDAADHGDQHVADRRVAVDSRGVVVQGVDQRGGRPDEIHAVDGAAVFVGALAHAAAGRSDVGVVRPQLPVQVRCPAPGSATGEAPTTGGR